MRQIHSFDNFIGQENIKTTIATMIEASKIKQKTLNHILIYGLPGTGKTTLANIIGNHMNKQIKYAQGPLLDKKSDIITLFSNIQEGDIIFIDEIHGINKNIEELMYSIMEEFKIDITIGKDSSARIMRLNLKNFTLIGATTKLHNMSQPMRDRFGYIAKMQPYNLNHIVQILQNYKESESFDIDKKQLELIANFTKYTPRVALNLLDRIIDFAVVNNYEKIDNQAIKNILKIIGIYRQGLSDEHIEYLKCLSEINHAKPVSLDVICGITNYTKENILSEIEPILMYLNFITKTSRGRKITQNGFKYLENYSSF